MSDRDIFDLRMMCNALDERVAKLEALIARKLVPTVPELPLASGQLASAGDATVPPGWKLAPGWSFGAHGDYDWQCWSGLDDDGEEVGETCKLRGPYLFLECGFASKGACAAHAVEMGALVRDEPPATGEQLAERYGFPEVPRGGAQSVHGWSTVAPAEQPSIPPKLPTCEEWCGELVPNYCCGDRRLERAEQPSRQETGGGETWKCPGCACCNDDACPTRHTDCETLCRDRAKAKAAEQAHCRRHSTSMVRVEKRYPDGTVIHALPCEECALEHRKEADRVRKVLMDACAKAKPAEPSGNRGQSPGVDWASMDKRAAEVAKWPAWKQKGTGLLPEPSGTGQLPSAPAGSLKSAADALLSAAMDYWKEYKKATGGAAVVSVEDVEGRLVILTRGEYRECLLANVDTLNDPRIQVRRFDEIEPIAEPPAPAAGALSDDDEKPLSARIYGLCNALPKVWLERGCDMAEEVRDIEARLAQAERERDDWRDRYDAAVADGRTLRESWEQAERERDDATAKERARCLAWANACCGNTGSTFSGIRDGKAAPGTDK